MTVPPAAPPSTSSATASVEGLEEIRRMWGDSPEDERIATRYGCLLALAGRYAEARTLFERAVALDPAAVVPYTNRGAALLRLDRPGEALRAYERALRIHPGLAQATQGRSRALQAILQAADAFSKEAARLFGEGQWNEAAERAACALRLRPDDAEARSTLLLSLRLASRHEERAAHLRATALAYAPRSGETAPEPIDGPFRMVLRPAALTQAGKAVFFASNRHITDPQLPDAPIRPGVFRLDNVLALPTDWSFATASGHHLFDDIVVAASALTPRYTGLCPHVRSLPDGLRQVSFARHHRYRIPAFFVGGSAANYYHWLLDYLPRIILYRDFGFAETGLRLALVRNPPAYVAEALDLLGLDDRHILWIDPETPAAFPALVVVSQFTRRGNIHPSTAGILRGALPPASAKAPWRRLYVSRADAGKRRILNEDELMHALGELGFERVVCSQLGFAEQHRLFSEAHVVVAPHGASLANLIWCMPDNGALVELLPDAPQMRHFIMLSELMRLRHVPVRSGPERTASPGDQGTDFSVDVNAVLSHLRPLLADAVGKV